MTQDELVEERRRAMNLLQAYEAGSMMNLDERTDGDFTNQKTEISIVALRARIAELERRIASHPDRALPN